MCIILKTRAPADYFSILGLIDIWDLRPFGSYTPFPHFSLSLIIKVELAVLGSPVLVSLMVSVDIKQH